MRASPSPARNVFHPGAYLLETATVPSQITIFSFTGGFERWCKIPLDLTKHPLTFAMQALRVARATPVVPFLGKTRGFVIYYAENRAVVFDLDGDPIEILSGSYHPGTAQLMLSRRLTDHCKLLG